MANKPLRTSNLAAVQLIIGNDAISGYGEGGAVAWEYGSDVLQYVKGQDGEIIASPTNDESMILTITVHEGSHSAQVLHGYYAAQKAALDAGLPIPSLPVFFRNPNNGDQVNDPYGSIMSIAPPDAQNKSTDREFKVMLPNGRANLVLAGSVLL